MSGWNVFAATPSFLPPSPHRCSSWPPEVRAARKDSGGGRPLLSQIQVGAAASPIVVGDSWRRRRWWPDSALACTDPSMGVAAGCSLVVSTRSERWSAPLVVARAVRRTCGDLCWRGGSRWGRCAGAGACLEGRWSSRGGGREERQLAS